MCPHTKKTQFFGDVFKLFYIFYEIKEYIDYTVGNIKGIATFTSYHLKHTHDKRPNLNY